MLLDPHFRTVPMCNVKLPDDWEMRSLVYLSPTRFRKKKCSRGLFCLDFGPTARVESENVNPTQWVDEAERRAGHSNNEQLTLHFAFGDGVLAGPVSRVL